MHFSWVGFGIPGIGFGGATTDNPVVIFLQIVAILPLFIFVKLIIDSLFIKVSYVALLLVVPMIFGNYYPHSLNAKNLSRKEVTNLAQKLDFTAYKPSYTPDDFFIDASHLKSSYERNGAPYLEIVFYIGTLDNNAPAYRMYQVKATDIYNPPTDCSPGNDGKTEKGILYNAVLCNLIGTLEDKCDVYLSDPRTELEKTAYCKLDGTLITLYGIGQQQPTNEQIVKIFDSLQPLNHSELIMFLNETTITRH